MQKFRLVSCLKSSDAKSCYLAYARIGENGISISNSLLVGQTGVFITPFDEDSDKREASVMWHFFGRTLGNGEAEWVALNQGMVSVFTMRHMSQIWGSRAMPFDYAFDILMANVGQKDLISPGGYLTANQILEAGAIETFYFSLWGQGNSGLFPGGSLQYANLVPLEID